MREIQFRPECSPRITLVACTIDIILANHHTFAFNSFKGTRPRKVLLVGGRGGGRFCCVSHLQCWFYSTRGFFYGCGFLLSGVWPRNVFALCFLHSFRRFHLTYIPICCEEVFYAVSNILGTFYYVAPATASFTVFIRVCIHSSEFVSIPVRLYCISCRSSTQSIVL